MPPFILNLGQKHKTPIYNSSSYLWTLYRCWCLRWNQGLDNKVGRLLVTEITVHRMKRVKGTISLFSFYSPHFIPVRILCFVWSILFLVKRVSSFYEFSKLECTCIGNSWEHSKMSACYVALFASVGIKVNEKHNVALLDFHLLLFLFLNYFIYISGSLWYCIAGSTFS